jgi:hypothetical protein
MVASFNDRCSVPIRPDMTDFSFQFSRLADLVNANCSEILIVGGKVSLSRLNEAIAFEVHRRKTLRRLFDIPGKSRQAGLHAKYE